ncbi:hypothetical protein N7465_000019 [Penicillium sp. CMV-2018d]|nr:hypothetical protein N7465_000019 [Penicillium sp. CMV-2018d]
MHQANITCGDFGIVLLVYPRWDRSIICLATAICMSSVTSSGFGFGDLDGLAAVVGARMSHKSSWIPPAYCSVTPASVAWRE